VLFQVGKEVRLIDSFVEEFVVVACLRVFDEVGDVCEFVCYQAVEGFGRDERILDKVNADKSGWVLRIFGFVIFLLGLNVFDVVPVRHDCFWGNRDSVFLN